jgi:hypothetical protein
MPTSVIISVCLLLLTIVVHVVGRLSRPQSDVRKLQRQVRGQRAVINAIAEAQKERDKAIREVEAHYGGSL